MKDQYTKRLLSESRSRWQGYCVEAMPDTAEIAEMGIHGIRIEGELDPEYEEKLAESMRPDPELEAWFEEQAKRDEMMLRAMEKDLPF